MKLHVTLNFKILRYLIVLDVSGKKLTWFYAQARNTVIAYVVSLNILYNILILIKQNVYYDFAFKEC